MNRPAAKGWCPGAWRPMASGDGLIVRVRPHIGRLSADQVQVLCTAALTHGNGIIGLTSRANLQIRGVSEQGLDQLLSELAGAGLLDDTPEAEAKRNIVITPLWVAGDLTQRLHDALLTALPHLPDLPAKMGVAVDTGPAPLLSAISADFRFERSASGTLILRLDGRDLGREIIERDAPGALIEAATWFTGTGGAQAGRMIRHKAPLPDGWATTAAATAGPAIPPGAVQNGIAFGAPFGAIAARDLQGLLQDTSATALRVTPWRVFILENARPGPAHGFLTEPGPLLRTRACPGAPHCASASVETRALARELADLPDLHVSGCAKGCAHPRPAATTLVGRDGVFDLVKHGAPWEEPALRGLTAAQVRELSLS
ncbi:hypothetical protein ACMU_15605 [Actibacterium mucosum KCTC 23349]|uniref:Nitrite/Sulfite reductase ferredoxin-like domain-containing protein n=1 Tax=Actibacterium mucosum KCTC 23349 TaxID=1454373 RepID=A0A037ZFC2_9RHOB|nr:hypothetical protein [Actibacterium mucosum]KAJ55180.1 hypothetical protein ACMU_15605 [Actibacterium mucosum KCTC 23349]